MKNFIYQLQVKKQTPAKRAGSFAILALFAALLPFNLLAQVPSISYSGPQAYFTGAPISPLAPASTGVAAPGYNPTIASTNLTGATGIDQPVGMASDLIGNIYVADYQNGLVKKLVGLTSSVNIGAVPNAYAVATDTKGNVYATDFGHGDIYMIPITAGTAGTPVIIGSGFSSPTGLCVDPKGNVYVADFGAFAVRMIPVGGGPVTTVGSGYFRPSDVALDSDGNMYVADTQNSRILKIPADGSAPYGLGPGTSSPTFLALDGARNVYTNSGHNVIQMLPATGGSPVQLANGYSGTNGITVDPSGNLFFADGVGLMYEAFPVGGYYVTPNLPAGLTFSNVTGTISGTPTAASPSKDYKIRGYNAHGKGSATLNIKVSNDGLSNFQISSGVLTPAFSINTTNYTVYEANTSRFLKITPTAGDAASTITVNGAAVLSGKPSAAIDLAVGANTITTIVSAADGSSQTFTLTATRLSAAAANLINLKIGGVTLSPSFSPFDTTYTASVPATVTDVWVTPTFYDSLATATINGRSVSSRSANSLLLNYGPNDIVTTVTAVDGVTTKSYTVTVTRAPASTDDKLANLVTNIGILNPVFDPVTNNYTLNIGPNVTQLRITPTANSPLATIDFNDDPVVSGQPVVIYPQVGTYYVSIRVTAQSGDSRTYQLLIYKSPQPSVELANLRTNLGPVNPHFSHSNLNYQIGVDHSQTSIRIVAKLRDTTSTIKINGEPYAQNTLSRNFTIFGSFLVLNLEITSADGMNSQIYSLEVDRGSLGGGGGSSGIASFSAMNPGLSEKSPLTDDNIRVHQGLSANGDGTNDFLVIDGIANFPENKLSVMDRNGALVFEAKGYDNQSKVFNGYSSTNHKKQNSGTYFYKLEYKVNGELKTKTGYLVIKN